MSTNSTPNDQLSGLELKMFEQLEQEMMERREQEWLKLEDEQNQEKMLLFGLLEGEEVRKHHQQEREKLFSKWAKERKL